MKGTNIEAKQLRTGNLNKSLRIIFRSETTHKIIIFLCLKKFIFSYVTYAIGRIWLFIAVVFTSSLLETPSNWLFFCYSGIVNH